MRCISNLGGRVLAAIALLTPFASAQMFSCGPTLTGVALEQQTRYSATQGGWDLHLPAEVSSANSCGAARDFAFSAPVAEGVYRVTVVLGGPERSVTTVRAEARRLMVRAVETTAGASATYQFNVSVRRPEIAGGGSPSQVVQRKPREMGSLDWDEKLTLVFSGERPSIHSILIEPVKKDVPTVYLAGDSTVVDQEVEPWSAWGQVLPAFFGPGVTVANEAESGETIASFESEGRFAKIFSTLKKGDYLFLQFAHNDMKPGAGYVSPEAYTALLRKYVAMARGRGATPVLVTSPHRRTFDATGHVTDSLAPYPATMRALAATDGIALIDLNAMSKALYEAVTEAKSRSLFVYAEAGTFPGQVEALHDDTHFNAYGAWELARCVVLGIQQAKLSLVKWLRAPREVFDPARPDDPAAVAVPATPFVDAAKPYER